MLVRTFRLSDKFSNAALKLAIYTVALLLERVAVLRSALAALVETFYSAARTTTEHSQRVVSERRRQVMVQRAQERALQPDSSVIEDPLAARNRSLSAIVVVLLVVLIGFLLFTADSDSSRVSGGSGIIPPAPISEDELEPAIPTAPPPTETPAIGVLSNVTGTLAFTVRQNGQEDIWALPVGSSQPARLTDSLEDDRHPAWSPDGGRLAFSSRRDGDWELYMLDLTLGQTTRLTFSPGYDGAPSWSPDGAFLVYESYNVEAGNIDLYIISADGQQGPFQFTNSPFPDTDPDWGPTGTEIAYIGWRNGSPDVLILSTQGQPEIDALNITSTANSVESAPVWSPEAGRIAYTAIVDGIEGIYVKDIEGGRARLIGRGRMPAWNPLDGSSVFYTVPQGDASAIYLGQVDNFGVGANAIAFSGGVSHVDWTPVQHLLTGFDPRTPVLYEETSAQLPGGRYGLALLANMPSTEFQLSDSVNQSFEALRRRVIEKLGYDLLGMVESAYWPLERPPEPGQDRENWHYTGRAFSLNRRLVLEGSPLPLVAVREDTERGTQWRLFGRVAENAQDGRLGEPLRALPWDFASRFAGDAEAFEQGGRLMREIPTGYYVDLTQLFADFGWERIQSDRNWRSNFSGVLFWQFQKMDGLDWQDAMLEIYSPTEVEAFLQGLIGTFPTAIPTATPITPIDEATPDSLNAPLPVDATPILPTGIPTNLPTATTAP